MKPASQGKVETTYKFEGLKEIEERLKEVKSPSGDSLVSLSLSSNPKSVLSFGKVSPSDVSFSIEEFLALLDQQIHQEAVEKTLKTKNEKKIKETFEFFRETIDEILERIQKSIINSLNLLCTSAFTSKTTECLAESAKSQEKLVESITGLSGFLHRRLLGGEIQEEFSFEPVLRTLRKQAEKFESSFTGISELVDGECRSQFAGIIGNLKNEKMEVFCEKLKGSGVPEQFSQRLFKQLKEEKIQLASLAGLSSLNNKEDIFIGKAVAFKSKGLLVRYLPNGSNLIYVMSREADLHIFKEEPPNNFTQIFHQCYGSVEAGDSNNIMELSPDERTLLITMKKPKCALLVDSMNGMLIRKINKVCQFWVVTATWLNNTEFAVGGKPEVLRIFSIHHEKAIVDKYGFGEIIWSMSAHSKSNRLFIGGYDGAVASFDSSRNDWIWIRKEFTLSVYCVSYNETTNVVAAGGKNKLVKFYSGSNGEVLTNLKEQPFLSKLQFVEWVPGTEDMLVVMSEWELALLKKDGRSMTQKIKHDLQSAVVDWRNLRVFVGDSMGGVTIVKLF